MGRRVTAIVVVILVLAGALLVLAFARPRKVETRIYRLGEQGLAQGSAEQEELDLKVVAEVAGHAITVGEVAEAVRNLPQQQRLYYSTPEKMRTFVQNYALLLLLSRQGEQAGLTARPYLRSLLERELAEQYRVSFLADLVKASDIGAEEIAGYLQTQPEAVGQGLGPEAAQAAARAAILGERRQEAWRTHLRELASQMELTGP